MQATTVVPVGDSDLPDLESTTPPLWIGGNPRILGPDTPFWGVAATELLSAPARTDGTDVDAAALQQFSLAGQMCRSLQPWQHRGALELRYVWGRRRLKLVLLGRALGAHLSEARAQARNIVDEVTRLFPDGYRFGEPEASMRVDATGWVEIERDEEVRAPAAFLSGDVGFYYLVHPMAGDGSAWPQLARYLADLDEPGFLSVSMLPTQLSDEERAALDHIQTALLHLAEPQQEPDFFGNLRTRPGDTGAADARAAWQQFPERSGLLIRVGIAAPPDGLHRLTAIVGSIITGTRSHAGAFLPTSYKAVFGLGASDVHLSANLGLVVPRPSHPVWQSPDAPAVLERLRYFFSGERAAGLCVLPVPDEHGIPGMPMTSLVKSRRASVRSQPGLPEVPLGREMDRGEASQPIGLSLESINRHVLVVGQPGSGKTTTVQTMLVHLWRKHAIPFLVIEPSTRQYRRMLQIDGVGADTNVFVLGRDDLSPLRLNPFLPGRGVRREVHASGLVAALKTAMPLGPPLPQLLEKAVKEVYEAAGWDVDTRAEDGIAPPTLRDLRGAFQEVALEVGYVGDATNVGRAGDVRLESLLQGSRGRMLDTVESWDFDRLMASPTVVELADIKDPDDAATVAALLLERIRDCAEARGTTRGQLRHVTVVEEAHRVLAGQDAPRRDEDDLQARSGLVRSLCQSIAELRAVGEGFILSSQRPSQLASDAVANTGSRLLHRLDATDRTSILDDLDASDTDRRVAARLGRGEAIMRSADEDEPVLVSIEPLDGIDTGEPLDDEAVASRMAGIRGEMRALLPYGMCTRDVCVGGCSPAVRRAGEQAAARSGAKARQLWRAGNAKPDVVPQIVELLSAAKAGAQQTYCAAVHLKVRGDALEVDDDAARLIVLDEIRRRS